MPVVSTGKPGPVCKGGRLGQEFPLSYEDERSQPIQGARGKPILILYLTEKSDRNGDVNLRPKHISRYSSSLPTHCRFEFGYPPVSCGLVAAYLYDLPYSTAPVDSALLSARNKLALSDPVRALPHYQPLPFAAIALVTFCSGRHIPKSSSSGSTCCCFRQGTFWPRAGP
jgi:hypothetical protein